MIKRITRKISKLGAAIALFVVEISISTVIFFLALFVFLYLVRRVFILKNSHFDQAIFDSLTTYVNPVTNVVMLCFSFLGSHEFLIPANLLLIIYFLFIRPHKWYSIKVPTIALTSLGLMFLLKHFFSRPRPLIPLLEEAKGLSFPSGHALMSMTFYGLLTYMMWRVVKNTTTRWLLGISFLLLVAMIGFSRIYLRVHYTSDVIAGYCMGLVWLIVTIRVIRGVERYGEKRKL